MAAGWWKKAKCRGLPRGMFILDKGHQPEVGMAVCNGTRDGRPCEVREACKQYAIDTGCVGVWGGEYFSTRDIGAYDETLVETIGQALMAIARAAVDEQPLLTAVELDVVAEFEQDARPRRVQK